MFPLEIRILVVDDMPSIRDMVKNQLRMMGYKNVTEAEDGEMAWEILTKKYEEGYPFHLVVSDWNMPKMKGVDLLKKVRANEDYKSVPFILLTSEAERDQVTEAVMAGVSQYIVKPFSPKAFEDKLKAAWTKHNKT